MSQKYTDQQLEQAVDTVGDLYQSYYLDWLNDFLTIEGYADYYGLSDDEAKRRVSLGRKIHQERTEG